MISIGNQDEYEDSTSNHQSETSINRENSMKDFHFP